MYEINIISFKKQNNINLKINVLKQTTTKPIYNNVVLVLGAMLS